MKRLPATSAPAILVLLSLALPARVRAQSDEVFGRRPSLWTIQLDLTGRLPGTIYNQFLERDAVHGELPGTSLQTKWKEQNSLLFEGRATLRYRPEAGAGLYLAGFWGKGNTDADYSGGNEAAQTIDRSVTYEGVDFGVSLKLKDWDQGRGLVEYTLGAAILRHRIDLSQGHRASLAQFPDINVHPDPPLQWSDRTFTNWGLSLGVSFRVPVASGLELRTSFRDIVLPVNTAQLADEEESDVLAISDQRTNFSYSPFTTHVLSLSVGLEYTLGWGAPRRRIARRLPGVREATEVNEEVAGAIRLAARGDTAAAISALEHRISLEPQDPHAWRELALLKAVRAEIDPSVRDEVLATLERALNLNPGDTELLRSYGRIRGLVQRSGREPKGGGAEPLAVSDLAVQATPQGDLSLAWAARNLRAGENGRYRYRVEVEAFQEDGSPAALRAGLDRFTTRDDGTLVMDGEAEELPITFQANVFLVDPEPGIHTVRVWVTDLATGQRTQSSNSFQIPAGG